MQLKKQEELELKDEEQREELEFILRPSPELQHDIRKLSKAGVGPEAERCTSRWHRSWRCLFLCQNLFKV